VAAADEEWPKMADIMFPKTLIAVLTFSRSRRVLEYGPLPKRQQDGLPASTNCHVLRARSARMVPHKKAAPSGSGGRSALPPSEEGIWPSLGIYRGAQRVDQFCALIKGLEVSSREAHSSNSRPAETRKNRRAPMTARKV
jgi:hypothetical protein